MPLVLFFIDVNVLAVDSNISMPKMRAMSIAPFFDQDKPPLLRKEGRTNQPGGQQRRADAARWFQPVRGGKLAWIGAICQGAARLPALEYALCSR
jgi:hypothetical protein